MVTKRDLEDLVDFINTEISKRLGSKIDALYLVGSYASGSISASRPDINWLLIHNEKVIFQLLNQDARS